MLRQIQYFISVVELKSFTEAAYENHISQSAISQQIKQLEDELGVTLLIRKNRSFEITPAGDYFYRHCKVLLQKFNHIKQETIRIGEDHELSLTIGFPRNLETESFQNAVIEFSSLYPEINISFETGNHEELFQLLLADKIDMKLSEQRRMYNQDYVNYDIKLANSYIEISAKDELAKKDRIDIEELQDRNCIIVASNEQREEEQYFYKHTLNISKHFLYADSLAQARMMVLSRRGFLLVDQLGILPAVQPGIKRIPVYKNNQPLQRNYFLCWKEDQANYYIEEFATLLKKQMDH